MTTPTPLFDAPPVAPLTGSTHFALRRNTPGAIKAHGLKGHVQCEECIWTTHEAKGKAAPSPRPATRRWTSQGIPSVLLCAAHAALWTVKPKGRAR